MKFETKLSAKDIFKFSLAYTYMGFSGILAIAMVIIGIYMCVIGVAQDKGASYIGMGIMMIALFIVVNPLMLYSKAKKQVMTNPVYQKPSVYEMKEEGIYVEIGDDSGTITWDRIQKVRHFMGMNVLYTGKQQAFVFPDEAMGEQKDEIMEFVKTHVHGVKTNRGAGNVTASPNISKYAKETNKEEE